METLVDGAIIVGLGAVAVAAGLPIVKGLLKLVDFTQAHDPESADHHGARLSVRRAARQLGGGAWIGMMERLAIYACVVCGFPEGIAIVLGVKGLARYPELSSPDAARAQAFIIGTFGSVLLAAACAGVSIWLIGVL